MSAPQVLGPACISARGALAEHAHGRRDVLWRRRPGVPLARALLSATSGPEDRRPDLGERVRTFPTHYGLYKAHLDAWRSMSGTLGCSEDVLHTVEGTSLLWKCNLSSLDF